TLIVRVKRFPLLYSVQNATFFIVSSPASSEIQDRAIGEFSYSAWLARIPVIAIIFFIFLTLFVNVRPNIVESLDQRTPLYQSRTFLISNDGLEPFKIESVTALDHREHGVLNTLENCSSIIILWSTCTFKVDISKSYVQSGGSYSATIVVA